jgi:hypothetical protein
MDPIEQCGNNLQFILYWLKHHHNPGDPLGPLVDVTNSLVSVLVSGQLANAALAKQFQAESAKALVAAAGKFTVANVAVHA